MDRVFTNQLTARDEAIPKIVFNDQLGDCFGKKRLAMT